VPLFNPFEKVTKTNVGICRSSDSRSHSLKCGFQVRWERFLEMRRERLVDEFLLD